MEHPFQNIALSFEGQVAELVLNRPAKHNAIYPAMLEELLVALDAIAQKQEITFLVLSGKGDSFCAGADIEWFGLAVDKTREDNEKEYRLMSSVLLKLFQLPQVTIAAVHGNAYGGGLGLMAACDFVLAENNTSMVFSEVKLGFIPATILPFVSKRLSLQQARKWILSGSVIDPEEALEASLIDSLVEAGTIKDAVKRQLETFRNTAPIALKKAKQLINRIYSGEIGPEDGAHTAGLLAEILQSDEGKEGVQSFLEKRKPNWKTKQ